jgi:hypothetical protein
VRSRAALAGLLLLAGAAARAQEAGSAGRFRLGPVHLTPRLQIKQAGVDTNVFQTLRDAARDEVVVFGPRLEGTLALRRLRATGLGYLEVNHFNREGDERFTDFYGEGRLEMDAGPLLLYGSGGGGRFHNRFSIDVDERLERQERRASLGLVWRLTRRMSATVQGGEEVLSFAPAVFRLGGFVKEAMDRRTRNGAGQLRFSLTNRTTLVLSAEVLEDRFFSQPLDSPRVRQSQRYLAGFELGERALLTGRVLAGLRSFPGTLAHGSPPYTGPVIAVDLALPLRAARVRFQGERDVQYAGSLVNVGRLRYRNAFVYERYRGEATLALPVGVVGVVHAGFENARYLLPYPYPDALHPNRRVDHRWTLGGSLLRQLGDRARMGAHLLWARRVSSLLPFSYQGVRYGLSMEIVP